MIHQRKIAEQRRVDASLAWLFLFAYKLYGGGVYKSWVQAPCPLIPDEGEMQAVEYAGNRKYLRIIGGIAGISEIRC